MTIAEHASNILDAWKYQDHSGLGAALQSASTSKQSALSDFENERKELLDSIVQHLSQLNTQDQRSSAAGANGAMALLSHLSSSASRY